MMPLAADLLQDLRFAVRSWAKAPTFAIAAIATLAIGIGANTTVFSVVSGVLLRPLPFADPDRLVQLYETQPRNAAQLGFDGPVVFQDFEQWRTGSRLVKRMAAYTTSARNLETGSGPEQVMVVAAERELFQLLGVGALAGRSFDEHDSPAVAVASFDFWQAYFGGDRAAIGRSILLDGQAFTLIGVMPKGFQFPYATAFRGLWIPWEIPPDLRSHPNRRLDALLARLNPGVTTEMARQELNGMESVRRGGRTVRVRSLKDVVSGTARESLLVLLGAVGMVLLIACANAANLMLARTASRGREIAIRMAVGADRMRMARQFLTESVMLALAGGIAGLGIGIIGTRLLVRLAGTQIPRAGEIGADWRVFAFLFAICLAAGITSGLAPAVLGARGIADGLARRGAGSAIRDALVAVEIALSFVLLVGAGLLGRTFLNLRRTDPGLIPENVLTAHVVLPGAPQAMALEDRVAHIPGVRAAGLISLLPLQNSNWSGGFTIPGSPEIHECELRYVTPGYLRAMGIPLRGGREFSASDAPGAPGVVLINETLARLYFRNVDPIARRLDRGVIVGVVGNVRQDSLGTGAKPEVIYPVSQNFAQIRRLGLTLVVRSSRPPEDLAPAIRAAVRDVIPGQAVFRVAAMQDVIEESLSMPRLYAWLMGLFAAAATVLAIAGIYGVVSYLVALRTREFGIRMALGADSGRVLGLVMSRSARLTLFGLVAGIGGAAGLTRVLRGVLYGVAATDATTFAAVGLLLAASSLAASLTPARRATRVDPAVALRCE